MPIKLPFEQCSKIFPIMLKVVHYYAPVMFLNFCLLYALSYALPVRGPALHTDSLSCLRRLHNRSV